MQKQKRDFESEHYLTLKFGAWLQPATAPGFAARNAVTPVTDKQHNNFIIVETN